MNAPVRSPEPPVVNRMLHRIAIDAVIVTAVLLMGEDLLVDRARGIPFSMTGWGVLLFLFWSAGLLGVWKRPRDVGTPFGAVLLVLAALRVGFYLQSPYSPHMNFHPAGDGVVGFIRLLPMAVAAVSCVLLGYIPAGKPTEGAPR